MATGVKALPFAKRAGNGGSPDIAASSSSSSSTAKKDSRAPFCTNPSNRIEKRIKPERDRATLVCLGTFHRSTPAVGSTFYVVGNSWNKGPKSAKGEAYPSNPPTSIRAFIVDKSCSKSRREVNSDEPKPPADATRLDPDVRETSLRLRGGKSHEYFTTDGKCVGLVYGS
ncbi:hypothetical protein V1478_011241 [Vespula squamosa]|uniref:Uncharacterized protein n=1 Tax=Vespula squamosa TaxID=30214 RepID=A0ABD2AET5_VESSQ